MNVELKGIKMAGGDETPRFEAALYIDGKKAAMVSNGGHGGSNQYWWFDKVHGESPLAKLFHAYCVERNPPDYEGKGYDDEMKARMLKYHECEIEDTEVYKLLDEFENHKRLKRACATKALCRLPGQTYKDGEWSAFKGKLTPEFRAMLVAKYPGIVFCADTL